MLDDKDSITNQQDGTKVNQEISPWLRERFEERAHPLTSQKQPQLVHGGSRLARWVVDHTGLTTIISRAERLTSLPRSFGSLINRKSTGGIPGQYQSMNLPWFEPKKVNGQGPANKIAFKSQGEIASDIEGRFDNKIFQLSPESSGEKQEIIDEKMPETYIEHLISPPLARKSAEDIINNFTSPTSTKSSYDPADHLTEINYSNDSQKVVERKPLPGTRIQPTSLFSSEIISRLNRLSPNTSSEQSSQSTNRTSLPIIPAQKNEGIINASSLEHSAYSSNRQKATGTKIVPNRLEVQQNGPDNKNGSPPLPGAAVRKAFDLTLNKTGAISTPDASTTKSSKIPTIEKLDATVQDDTEKDTKNSNSSKESLYGKPLSIGQRIVQSLPFIKNISRKMSRPAEPIAAEKQTEVNINRLPMNNLETVHPHNETPEIKLDNAVITDIPDTSKTEPVDFTSAKGFKERKQESPTAETTTMKKLGTTVKEGTKKDAGHAYPTKDLPYGKSSPIGQRIAQSLPLMRNISSKVDLSPEASLSINRKQHELNDIPLPLANLEMLQVHGTSDGIGKSKTDSLLIPQIISDRAPRFIDNKISVNRKPEAIYDGTRTANNKLDLVLTPVNRLPTTQQDGNYYQSDQSTQYIQRAQSSAASQSTQQTQAGQPSQPNATQAAEMRPSDENVNANEYRPDIRALAREIYPLIRRMIVVERERRPSR